MSGECVALGSRCIVRSWCPCRSWGSKRAARAWGPGGDGGGSLCLKHTRVSGGCWLQQETGLRRVLGLCVVALLGHGIGPRGCCLRRRLPVGSYGIKSVQRVAVSSGIGLHMWGVLWPVGQMCGARCVVRSCCPRESWGSKKAARVRPGGDGGGSLCLEHTRVSGGLQKETGLRRVLGLCSGRCVVALLGHGMGPRGRCRAGPFIARHRRGCGTPLRPLDLMERLFRALPMPVPHSPALPFRAHALHSVVIPLWLQSPTIPFG